MISSHLRRLFRRLRYPTFKNLATLVSFCLWMSVLTLWVNSSGPKVVQDLDLANTIHSEFPKSSVHKVIEGWHLSDEDGKMPFFFSLHNSKFSAFPVERLSIWSDVPLNHVRCPGWFSFQQGNERDLFHKTLRICKLRIYNYGQILTLKLIIISKIL